MFKLRSHHATLLNIKKVVALRVAELLPYNMSATATSLDEHGGRVEAAYDGTGLILQVVH